MSDALRRSILTGGAVILMSVPALAEPINLMALTPAELDGVTAGATEASGLALALGAGSVFGAAQTNSASLVGASYVNGRLMGSNGGAIVSAVAIGLGDGAVRETAVSTSSSAEGNSRTVETGGTLNFGSMQYSFSASISYGHYSLSPINIFALHM
jgi:hypothetical protein